MKTPLRLKASLVVLAATASVLITASVLAQQPPPQPSGFYGTVKVNSANVPDGTPVEAWIGNLKVASTTTQTFQGNSVYALQARSDDPVTPQKDGGVAGDTVQFKVDQKLADQTGTWSSGANIEKDLTVTIIPPGITARLLPNQQEVMPGKEFPINLVVDSGDRVAGIQSGVRFDSSLIEFRSVAPGGQFTGCELSGSTPGPGRADVVQVCTDGTPGAPPRLVINLRALAVPARTTTEVSLQDLKLFDKDGKGILPVALGGPASVVVLVPTCGDVDGDGAAGRADVRKLIDFILHGGATEEQMRRANVVVDGELNAGDGVVLLRFVEGLVQNLNCGPLQ